MLRIIFTILFIQISYFGFGQEFNLNVRITSPNNTIVEDAVFNELERSIEQFYNGTKWTDDVFEDAEKIKGNINLTVTKETGPNEFTVDILFQTERPVYKSSYKTPMLNYLDRGINVNYQPGQIIEKSELTYNDNLSSILTFYAYIMLGMDYDSFEAFGGNDFFIKARDIMATLPPSLATSAGWNNTGNVVGRNRYWMTENLLSPKMRVFRRLYYEYHRLGLDELYKDAARQRAVISSALTGFQDAINDYPSSMILQMFSDSKNQELVDIFSVADRGQKKKVYDIMIQCDPSRADNYKPLSR
jgi:hypothetical protein